jgi:hypothetical protein
VTRIKRVAPGAAPSRYGTAALLLALAAVAIVLSAAGCGSDSSGETSAPSVSIPAVTAPGLSSSTQATTTSGTAPGTTVTTKGGKTYNPSAPDSATNDVPPAKGSPQAAFEQQCKKQGTCN